MEHWFTDFSAAFYRVGEPTIIHSSNIFLPLFNEKNMNLFFFFPPLHNFYP